MNIVRDKDIEYYTIERIEDVQNQMLDLLKMLDSICKKNGIQYFLDGGTAIGAYRHKGFIPWDDDLDVSMVKSDYLILIELLKKMEKKHYFLFDYNLDSHCCAFFGEKINLFPSYSTKKYHIYPIKIDIRPLNAIDDSFESIHKNRIYRELANYLIFNKCHPDYIDIAIDFFKNNFSSNRQKFFRFYNTEYGLCDNLDNSVLVHPYMEYSTDRCYKADEIFPLKKVEFEDFTTFVPQTDALLREVYDNYMEMPGIDYRKPEAVRIFEAKNADRLYSFLLDRREKSFIEKAIFAIEAVFQCK